ncbi:hypothetical protein IQ255_29135 [Pleurocapsales cyanobacterium LEGE 10410]|nr:hypothetical protein [Pleurocapsales cyanobacterium LEGE 10410]
MMNYTEFLYSFPNASSTLRVIRHLRNNYQSALKSVTVINLVDRWLLKANLKDSMSYSSAKNLQAFFSEMGIFTQPSPKIIRVLARLEAGESPTAVMNRYQVVIVAYGKPELEEIEIFRDQIIERLGYCPQNMV